ncbi:MAG TPA: HAD-IA family hydrolase [Polyangiaceae bacterium]|nr:HAD-IA family hydrolase [Polyangiaceae bacterium]
MSEGSAGLEAPRPTGDSDSPLVATQRHAAWLLDLDGTLYWAPGVKLAMACELLLFGMRVLPRLRRFRHEHERLREDGGHGDDPFALQLARTASALALDVADLERDVRTWMIERPRRYVGWFRRSGLLRAIERFRRHGGRTAVVSDYPALAKLEALRARELFEVVIANGEPFGPRRLKPDPDGYLKAAQALGVPPRSCLVIGDRDDADGAAARSAGMSFCHVRAFRRYLASAR